MTAEDLSAPGEIHALLGRGTAYQGKLTFEGRVRIDGTFEGEVFSTGTLIIGDSADVKGSIDVGTLIVLGGVVEGQVHARELVELHAPGRVVGDIVTPQLFVDRGVIFEGQCTMGDDAGTPPETHSMASEEKLLSDLESAPSLTEADPPSDDGEPSLPSGEETLVGLDETEIDGGAFDGDATTSESQDRNDAESDEEPRDETP